MKRSKTSFKKDVVDLIRAMVKVFKNKKKNKDISNRIQRGRASASASVFEEELAKLIEKYTPKHIELLVDYPFSFEVNPPCQASLREVSNPSFK